MNPINPYFGKECPKMRPRECNVEIKCPGCPLKDRSGISRYGILKKSIEENKRKIEEDKRKIEREKPIKLWLWKF
jgi:hypothetical protein